MVSTIEERYWILFAHRILAACSTEVVDGTQPDRNHRVFPSTSPDPPLDVGFQYAEYIFMSVNRHLQGAQQTLGGMPAGNNSLSDHNRFRRCTHWLRIEPEIDQQFLRRAGDAAEIGIVGNRIGVVYLNLNWRRR